MKTKHTLDSIIATNVLGLLGILKILGIKKTFFSTWVEWLSAALSVTMLLICCFCKIDPYIFVVEMKTIMLNVLPSIIGFSLAGYSLVVGFVQAGMLNRITEPLKAGEDNFSLYQKMSAAFAMNIILQTIALLISISVYFIIIIDDNIDQSFFSDLALLYINWMGLFIISYWFFLSLFLTIQIVINIFSFSQLHQYLINRDKLNNTNEHK